MENETIENNTISEETSVVAYDYYDSYYQEVLTDLENVQTQQNTIITNQETLIACEQEHNTSFDMIVFLLGLGIIIDSIRNMIKKV